MSKYKTPTIDELCSTILSYYPDAKLDLVRSAYQFADNAHRGQLRSSGEPYIIHPLEVAQTLADLRMDTSCIITGLLHDTVEDTLATLDEIEKLYGKDISELVDGVTKLSKITFKTSEEKQAENFRKMIIAMAKDIRVIIVKLADRLNNMRTLQYLNETKQKSISQETLDIYAPIANRLGMGWIKTELEDLCLRYLHPEIYYKLRESVAFKKKEREEYIEQVVELVKEKLQEYDVKAQVTGRAKHFYSMYKKMERRNIDFDHIYDLIAFRILVDNITECYKTLGVIHSIFKPVPGRFKDYIAMPKANSYQSLHSTVIGPNGERIEIQIRTTEMHQIAEQGIAAHWRYKEGRFGAKAKENVDWVNRLLEWQKDLSDPNEFLETVKTDLFAEDVFVFTPKGEVRQIPYGGTPLDFAYAIHTEVGNHCVSAKANGKMVPLRHKLKSGDTVEILTSTTQQPSKDWLKIVKSSRAKAKIRAFIKLQERSRARELGHEILEKTFKRFELNLGRIEKSGQLLKATQTLNMKTIDELFISVGYGKQFDIEVLEQFITKEEIEKKLAATTDTADESVLKKIFRSATKRSENKNAIVVADLNDVLIRMAKCCNPLPGDNIIGFITRGRGVTIHSANCSKAHDTDQNRRVDVSWNVKSKGSFKHHAQIRILSEDSPGILAEISKVISAAQVNITSASIKTTKEKKAVAVFDLEVHDKDQLSKICSAIEAKKGVISVERSRS